MFQNDNINLVCNVSKQKLWFSAITNESFSFDRLVVMQASECCTTRLTLEMRDKVVGMCSRALSLAGKEMSAGAGTRKR